MTPEQKKEILESNDFEVFCAKNVSNCDEKILRIASLADSYYAVKLEAEKAKVEKLKNALSNALIAADFF